MWGGRTHGPLTVDHYGLRGACWARYPHTNIIRRSGGVVWSGYKGTDATLWYAADGVQSLLAPCLPQGPCPSPVPFGDGHLS